MERGGRAHHARGGGQGRGREKLDQTLHTRERNWSVQETEHFLNVTRHVQIKVGRSDLKFIGTEWNTIWEAFHRATPTYHPPQQRGVDSLKNRLKTLKTEYGNIKDLLNRSGWSWDSVNHQVLAPDQDAWNDLAAQNHKKWRYYRKKKFPFLTQFSQLIGSSAATGDWGEASAVSTHSASGSSIDPNAEDGGPVNDSSERERFDFQELRHTVEEETLQGPREDAPAGVQQPSADTDRTSTRTGSTNKRKRAEAPERSRSRRAKKSIMDSQARDEGVVDAMGHLVKSADRLVEQNEEYLAIQHEKVELNKMLLKKQIIPQEIVDALKSYGLNNSQRKKVMHALKDPVDQQCFMDATTEEQIETISEYIPGFSQTYYGGLPPNSMANGGPFTFFTNFNPNLNGHQPPN